MTRTFDSASKAAMERQRGWNMKQIHAYRVEMDEQCRRRHMEGETYRSIAESLGVSLTMVRIREARAWREHRRGHPGIAREDCAECRALMETVRK